MGRIAIAALPKDRSVQSQIFLALSQTPVLVDDIVQTEEGDKIAVAFTVEHGDLAEARDVVRGVPERMGLAESTVDVEIGLAKISAVGTGMRSHVGVAGRMFEALDTANVPILNITTSEIRISCLVPHDRAEDGMRAVHDAFGLESLVNASD